MNMIIKSNSCYEDYTLINHYKSVLQTGHKIEILDLVFQTCLVNLPQLHGNFPLKAFLIEDFKISLLQNYLKKTLSSCFLQGMKK